MVHTRLCGALPLVARPTQKTHQRKWKHRGVLAASTLIPNLSLSFASILSFWFTLWLPVCECASVLTTILHIQELIALIHRTIRTRARGHAVCSIRNRPCICARAFEGGWLQHTRAHWSALGVMSFMRADNHMCVIQLHYARQRQQYYAVRAVRWTLTTHKCTRARGRRSFRAAILID